MRRQKTIVLMLVMIAVGISMLIVSSFDADRQADKESQNTFAEPRRREKATVLQIQVAQAFQKGDIATAEALLRDALELTPNDPVPHYNLACALARQKKMQEALASLKSSIELGFRDPDHITTDPDLNNLHDADEWPELVNLAKNPTPAKRELSVSPALIRNRVAFVGEKNVVWDPDRNVFRVFFQRDEADTETPPIIRGDDEVATLVNDWFKDGTAAGLSSVLYDNHDRDHSNIDLRRFPTLTRVEYSQAAAAENLDHGLQVLLSFNAITIGNSSTSIVGGPYWRSQARSAQTNPRDIALQAEQYRRNHLYVYPEHNDYDPVGSGGHGDVFPANTPYVLVSQGSSFSDKPFLDALMATTAAFRPATLDALKRNGLVSPTLQMIFRRCLKDVESDDDYLSGNAHPPVFDSSRIDALRMVNMAHDMLPENLPPIADMKVMHENTAIVGRDYFDIGPRESLFTTPSAIARICRSMEKTFVITIDAQTSRDVHGQPLTWHWSLLQGDPERVTIEPLNDQNSVATLRVDYHTVRPVREGSDITSSRVDIAVFAHNGTYASAPAIVSFYWPADEERHYHNDGRIKSVTYNDPADGGPYLDPFIITAKDWTDEYSYTDTGELIGWTRIRGDSKQQFTRHGHQVIEVDAKNRPLRAQPVTYSSLPRDDRAPLLIQEPVGDPVTYEYASADDRLGEIAKADSE